MVKHKSFTVRRPSVKRKKTESSDSDSSSDSSSEKKRKLKKIMSKRRSRTPSTSSSSSSSSLDSSSSSTISSSLSDDKPHSKKSHKKTKLKKKKATTRKMKKPTAPPALECTDIPLDLMENRNRMAPMTKEQWEQQQSTVRRVYDETTGRHRLIKGDGEVMEEIVSRDRHRAINKQATKGDGDYFQTMLNKK